ncbi:VOC family protein [Stackebrandtia endophytica]|uniref:VOC family protein n=1 Tax=Stackebrandtia endophytica TaxID=1496996 RepID=UPI001153F720|nr:VOC family protein [Stackebrandtia endophytica]
MRKLSEMAPQFVEGAPYWVDLSAADVPAAADFYCRLFGWEATDLGEEAGHYTNLTYQGQEVAAIGPAFNTDVTPQWITYFKSNALYDTTKAIEAAGGVVRMPPMDVFDQTSIAQFTDPVGAEFAVSQPKKHTGAGRWGDVGSVCWVELHLRQAEPSVSFYQRVFGWTTRNMPMGGDHEDPYTLLIPSGQDDSFGGIYIDDQSGQTPRWWVYFGVEDHEAAAAKAVEMGGSRLAEPMSVPEVGSWSVLADPSGSMFCAFTPPN